MIEWILAEVCSVNVCYCSTGMGIVTLNQTELYIIIIVSVFTIVVHCSKGSSNHQGKRL